MADQQLRVVFLGRVQGVGFRYTVCRLAERYPEITGYVKNQLDGSLEMVAEGPRDKLSELAAEVRERMSRYISDVAERWAPGSGEYDSFGVRF
jgi:acylphosphatase